MGLAKMSKIWLLSWLIILIGQQPAEQSGLIKTTMIPVPMQTKMEMIVGSARGATHNGQICSTWGNSHFSTYDGDFFQLPYACNYILTTMCDSTNSDFNIQLRREYKDNLPAISSFTINLEGIPIMLHQGNITLNDKVLTIPGYYNGIRIEKMTKYIKISSKIGLMVFWDEANSLSIEISPNYRNKTCGVCGDFNGILQNEFIENGQLLNPDQIGFKWKMDAPTETCEQTPLIPVEACQIKTNICEELLHAPAFESCHNLLPMSVYLEACSKDLCQCNSSQNICICDTISEFSRQCAHAGGSPGNWRSNDFCGKKCPLNMIHSECGSPCIDTCSNQEGTQVCTEHCVDGCVCPPGTVLNDIENNGCVPVDECPCTHNGKNYQPGESFTRTCQTCVCSNGRWNCSNRNCPGTCSLLGGSHVITYDSKTYSFNGNCDYILSKDNNNNITVLVNMAQCGLTQSETCLTSVKLTTTTNSVTISSSGNVFINNVATKLPIRTGQITIFGPSSFYIMVHTPGLKIVIQLSPVMQVYTQASRAQKGTLSGLCGNFNDMQGDDFKTHSGLIEGTSTSFASAWKAKLCQDFSASLSDPCSMSVEKEKYAKQWCEMLSDPAGVFSPCHFELNPKDYVTRCKYDACNCAQSENCMCAAVSSYVHACAERGVMLKDWRNNMCDTYKNNCPGNMEYSYNQTSCRKTCRSLGENDHICDLSFTPVDGCGCPKDTYLNDRDECVLASDCPCYINNEVLAPGQINSQPGSTCTCRDGVLQCTGHKEVTTCTEPMVYFNCSDAEPGKKGTECQNSCQTPTDSIQCTSTQCKSGCVCPGHLLADGQGGCVKEEQCPCVHNGVFYQPGETVKADCNNCTCKNRKWICTQKECHKMCTIYGDSHYNSFDGRRYTFNGNCEYTLAQDYCGDSNSGSFRIITENIPCGTTGTTCSKSIKIYLGNKQLLLSEENIKSVQYYNGTEIPYKIHTVGIYMVIEAKNNLTVFWDKKTSLMVKLGPSFKGTVCGLCGNYDGDWNNDFITRGGERVAEPAEFGNSWRVSTTCPEASGILSPCDMRPYRQAWAMKQCSILKSDVFSTCHSVVDPTQYYDACVRDTCACDAGGDCECFCTAVAAYAAACSGQGVCILWRSPTICPLFCDYYNNNEGCEWHYKPCGQSCMKTCKNPSGVCYSEIPPLEGCFPQCPSDRPYLEEATMKCVAREECGCYDDDENNIHYNVGDKMPTTKNCMECICTTIGPSCTYIESACYCEYNGQTYRPGWLIYSTTDGDGICINASCGQNGTIVRNMRICPTTAPPTTKIFNFTSTMGTSKSQTTAITTALPPTTIKTSSTTSTTTPYVCQPCHWSEWLDSTYPPSTPDGKDIESIPMFWKLGDITCEKPAAIDCRATLYKDKPLSELGQEVTCNITVGLICNNADQNEGHCLNYEMRVKCCDKTCPPTSTTGPIIITSTVIPPTTTEFISETTVRTLSTTTTAPVFSTTGPTTEKSTVISPTTTETGSTTTVETQSTTTSSVSSTTLPTTIKSTVTSPTTTEAGSTTTVETPSTTTSPVSSTTGPTTIRSTVIPPTTTETGSTTSVEITTSASTTTPYVCQPCHWSEWLDSTYPPSTPDGKDIESIPMFWKSGDITCEKPAAIDCRATLYKDKPLSELGQEVTCNITVGLICNNADQNEGHCLNYEMRVKCCDKTCPPTSTTGPIIITSTVIPPTTTEFISETTVRTLSTTTTAPVFSTTGPTTEKSTVISPTTTETGSTTTVETQTTTSPVSSTTLPTTIKSTVTSPTTTEAGSTTTVETPSTTTSPVSSTTGPTTIRSTVIPPTTTETGSTTSVEITTSASTTTPYVCQPCHWSEWLDSTYPPSTPDGKDTESIPMFWKSGDITCEKPAAIDCRATLYKDKPLSELGQEVTCNITVGLICNNADQIEGHCLNYEMRVKCCDKTCPSTTTIAVSTTTSPVSSTTGPIITTSTVIPPTTTEIISETTVRTLSTTTTAPVFSTTGPTTEKSTAITPTTTKIIPETTFSVITVSTVTPTKGQQHSPTQSTIPTTTETISKTTVVTASTTTSPVTSIMLPTTTKSTVIPPTTTEILSETTVGTSGTTTTSPVFSTTGPITSKSTVIPPTTTETGSTKTVETSRTTTSPVSLTTLPTTTKSTAIPPTTTKTISKTTVETESTSPVSSTTWPTTSKATVIPPPTTEFISETTLGTPSTRKTEPVFSTTGPTTTKSTVISPTTTETGSTTTVETQSTTTSPVSSTTLPTTIKSTVTSPTTTEAGSTTTVKTPSTTTSPVSSTTGPTTIKSTVIPPTTIETGSTTSVEITTSASTTTPYVCQPCHWSEWLDSTYPPSTPNGKDIESIPMFWKLGDITCEKPAAIDCRATLYKDKPLSELGQEVTCNITVGLICNNADQNEGHCLNYEMRVKCCDKTCPSTTTIAVSTTTSPVSSTTGPIITTSTVIPPTTTEIISETTVRTLSTTTTAPVFSTTGPTTEKSTAIPPTTTKIISETTFSVITVSTVTPTKGPIIITSTVIPPTTTEFISETTLGTPSTRKTAPVFSTTGPTTTKSTVISPTTTETGSTTTVETQTTTSPVSSTTLPTTIKSTVTSPTTTEAGSTTTVETPSTTTSPVSSTTGPTTIRSTVIPPTTIETGSTTSVEITTNASTTTPYVCQPCHWSEWLDSTYPPSTPDGKDIESIPMFWKSGDITCEKPAAIDCRATLYKDKPLSELGQEVTCNITVGLICNNADQIEGHCLNYEMRVKCCDKTCPSTTTIAVSTTTSPVSSTTGPIITTSTVIPPTTTEIISETTVRTLSTTTTAPVFSTTGPTTEKSTAIPPTTTKIIPETTFSVITVSTVTPTKGQQHSPTQSTIPTTTETISKTTVVTASTTTSPVTSIMLPTTTKSTVIPPTTTEILSETTVGTSGTTTTSPVFSTTGPITSKSTVIPPTTTETGSTKTVETSRTTTSPVSLTTLPTTTKSTAIPPTTTKTISKTTVETESTSPVSSTTWPTTSKATVIPPPTTEFISETTLGTPSTRKTEPVFSTTGPTTTKSTVISPTTTETGSTTTVETQSTTTSPVSSTTLPTTIKSTVTSPTTTEAGSTTTVETPSTTTSPVFSTTGLTTTKSTVIPPTTTETGSTTTVETSSTTTTAPVSSTKGPTTTLSIVNTTSGTTSSMITTSKMTFTTGPHFTTGGPCFCKYMDKVFYQESVIYNQTDGTGWCFTAYCDRMCQLIKTSGPCYSISTPPPSTTPTMPSSSTKLITTTPHIPKDCTYLDPPRKNGESWQEKCYEKKCIDASVMSTPVNCIDSALPMPVCENAIPPVKVYDKTGCCFHYECQCKCLGWGDPHYVTFDGLYYAFQGDCTYVLVQEIIKTYNFSVHIKNYLCDTVQQLSCPDYLTIYYKSYKIDLKQTRNPTVNKVFVNNVLQKSTVFSNADFTITTTGIAMTLDIPAIQAQVTFKGMNFVVNLPFSLFYNNTEGQCGKCDNNRSNDCRLPNGQEIQSCEAMAPKWLVNSTNCLKPSPPPPPPPKPSCDPSICRIIFSKVFQECHKVLDPENFYKACVFDMCNMKNGTGCFSLQSYAHMCASQSVCVDWRGATNGQCPPDCPKNKVYMPCGPKVENTCNSVFNEKFLQCDNQVCQDHFREGCFCPNGTTLFDTATDTCTSFCGCTGSDGMPKQPGDKWRAQCNECTCSKEAMGPVCQPVQCPPKENCTKIGYGLQDVDCCQKCVCQPSLCPSTIPKCQAGFELIQNKTDTDCCVTFNCKHKPVCVFGMNEYLPGDKVPTDSCEVCHCGTTVNTSTGLYNIQCTPMICNTTCQKGFSYEAVSGQCCGKCVQKQCVYENEGHPNIISTVEVGQSWTHPNEPCVTLNCTKVNDVFVLVKKPPSCPEYNQKDCIPGTETTTSDGCCKTCQLVNCRMVKNTTSLNVNGCISVQPVEIPSCSGSCNTNSIYSMAANTMTHHCSCCKELRTSSMQVQLRCADNRLKQYTYTYVEECGCSVTECTDSKV
ncbi:uncharacterized protein Hap1MRO34_016080 [Clarias gariepinus]